MQATAQNTKNAAARFPNLPFNTLGNTDLLVSATGFGSYRVDVAIDQHHQALKQALLSGINLIDTSANYADGASEQLIGSVLAECIAKHQLQREEIVIVSKAGYIQGKNLQVYLERLEQNQPFDDVVDLGEDLKHCMHPGFLEDQLSRSLERLQVDCLDVFLLHNPEYYLMWAEKNQLPEKEARNTYYERIAKAFAYLETEVEKGRIQYYGVSSNSFPQSAQSYSFSCLEKMWQLAEDLSSNHHFAVVQLPFNLCEHGAAIDINQPSKQSVLDFAQSKNLGVLTNRPLNAFYEGRLLRLANPAIDSMSDRIDVEKQLKQLQSFESDFFTLCKKKSAVPEATLPTIETILSVGHSLEEEWLQFRSHDHWQHGLQALILPSIRHGLELLGQFKEKSPEFNGWFESYLNKINRTLAEISNYFLSQDAVMLSSIRQNLVKAMPKLDQLKNLSQMALRLIRTTPGVSCVLLGMRHVDYVNDAMHELKSPVTPKPNWQSVAKQISI